MAEADPNQAEEGSIQTALRRYMEQTPLPFAITLGPDHTLAYANSSFCRLAGVSSSDALASPLAAAPFIALERTDLTALLDQAFSGRVDLLDRRLDGSRETKSGWRCSVWPVISEDGRSKALGIEIREAEPSDDDLNLQRQVAEQLLLSALRERGLAEDAEAARRRASFLAEASRLLAQSVDHTSTLVALTKLTLPALGSWCIVDILQEGDAINRLGIYHPDPEKQKLAQQLEATWFAKSEDPFGAPEMLRKARPVVLTQDTEVTLATTVHSPNNLHILRQLGIGALLTVPLVARQKLLGAITFVSAQRGYSYTADDVHLAEELAARGALALDNAQVYDLALLLKQTAETANRAKTAFLGAMSHELRTPLNAIGGYIELLDMGLRGPVTEDQRADFARVRTNQQHLTLLITEILNFVRVGSGTMSYASLDVNGRDALVRSLELVEPLIAQKGLVFDAIECDSDLFACADPERVTQILVNLLSNAIKFTPSGGRITAECTAGEETVTLSISDTGVGIAAEKLAAIFEPFVQLKEGLAHRESGIGLGLAISRDLARAMKGDLVVESIEGSGTCFSLILPRSVEAVSDERRRRAGHPDIH